MALPSTPTTTSGLGTTTTMLVMAPPQPLPTPTSATPVLGRERRPRARRRTFSMAVILVALGFALPGLSSSSAIVGSRSSSSGIMVTRRAGRNRATGSVGAAAAAAFVATGSSSLASIVGVRGGEIDDDDKKKKATATTRKKKSGTGTAGGGGKKKGGVGGKKKKKKKKRDGEGTTKQPEEDDGVEAPPRGGRRGDDGKRAIDDAMRGTDAAQALGDAIRERRDILLSDPPDGEGRGDGAPPVITVVDSSLASLGLSLGTSDSSTRPPNSRTGGGAAAMEATAATTGRTVADYFLRGGHGGAYAAQSAASALAVGCGAGCLALLVSHRNSDTSSSSPLPLILLRRCLLAAMAKHASGLFAAALVSARAIPTDGLRKTRARLEGLVLDPVAQYLCYSALLLVWTGATPIERGGGGPEAPLPWWMGRWYLVSCLLGPVLLREVVHVAWVLSDVAVISAGGGGGGNVAVGAATGVVDAVMSLLSGADRWRGTDAAGRQRILAKLVGRLSLSMELVTGLIIALDALRAVANYSLSSDSASRPPMRSVLTRLLCARLYVNFLLVRRRKIKRLVTDIRGGASAAPVAILDALLEPRKAMGLSRCTSPSVASTTAGDGVGGAGRDDDEDSTKERGWVGLAAEGLGF